MSLSRIPKLLLPVGLLAALLLLAACGSDDDSTTDSGGDSTVALSECTPDKLETVSGGKLTVATDDPAFEPYFVDNDPTNGEGFESAVAYAIADKLGFTADQVEWTVVPFNSSYAPGPKDFDFDVNQISITPQRAKVRRVCALSQGRSSVSPSDSGPPSNTCATAAGVIGPKATRPSGVSTSTSGSSQTMPRLPLRTSVRSTPRCAARD